MAIAEKMLCPEQPNLAFNLDNLAALYRQTGRAEEASVLEQRAAAIRASSTSA